MPGEHPACNSAGGRTTRRLLALLTTLPGLLAVLAPIVATGQDVDVDRADIYLRGGRLPSGAWSCGFAILANHRTRDDPHIEWDVNVEQVNNGTRIVTSVSAASFTVSHRTRLARALGGELSFVLEPAADPIHLSATGQADGSIHAELANEDATRLFAAVGSGSVVTIIVRMQDGAVESLRFHLTRDTAGSAQGAFASLCRPGQAGSAASGENQGGSGLLGGAH
ncbi:MAG: hypothetical protein JSR36_01110 [Proteobacteria bacterium]|nr:hypothetical protein [Pseudomonadota bacterium]